MLTCHEYLEGFALKSEIIINRMGKKEERERKGSTTERRSGRNGAKERRRKPLEMGTDGEEATGEARKRQKGEKDTAKRHARGG